MYILVYLLAVARHQGVHQLTEAAVCRIPNCILFFIWKLVTKTTSQSYLLSVKVSCHCCCVAYAWITFCWECHTSLRCCHFCCRWCSNSRCCSQPLSLSAAQQESQNPDNTPSHLLCCNCSHTFVLVVAVVILPELLKYLLLCAWQLLQSFRTRKCSSGTICYS